MVPPGSRSSISAAAWLIASEISIGVKFLWRTTLKRLVALAPVSASISLKRTGIMSGSIAKLPPQAAAWSLVTVPSVLRRTPCLKARTILPWVQVI